MSEPAIPNNKDLSARLPSDLLSKGAGFTKADWDRSMVAFLNLADDGQRYELARSQEFYRAARKRLPKPWRAMISASLDLLSSLAGLRPAVRGWVAGDLRRRLEDHLSEGE